MIFDVSDFRPEAWLQGPIQGYQVQHPDAGSRILDARSKFMEPGLSVQDPDYGNSPNKGGTTA